MTLVSLEEFDRENAKQRARLEKEHALVRHLPTHGVIVEWIGEGGWEKDGNTKKPPVQRRIDIVPHIVHSPFRGAEHVAYKAPDSLAGDKGEHCSSEYREEFVRRYFMAVIAAYRPFMVDTLALKGTYASMARAGWDWENDRGYKDASVLARGQFVITTGRNVGEHPYSTAELYFYAEIPNTGPLKVSFDLAAYGFSRMPFNLQKLYPWPLYESPRAAHREDAHIRTWASTDLSDIRGAQHKFQRSGDGSGRTAKSWYMEWLMATEETMLAAIMPPPKP